MKSLIKNIAVFIFLTFAVSAFVACTKTISTPLGSPAAGTASDAVKSNNFPPVSSSIMQAEIKELDGKTFKLEDKRGKVVLVNLWAIWCGPCVEEMPALDALQEKYKDKNFEVLGLNAGGEDGEEEPAENIKSFAAKKPVNYHLAYADPKLMNDLMKISKQGGIPQSFLIDREGKLRGVFFGGGQRIINEVRETTDKVLSE